MILTCNGIPINGPVEHSGIPGMKWGRRRYQNEDGSLTEEGRKRYGKKSSTKRKVATALGIAGAAALGYAAYSNPRTRLYVNSAMNSTAANAIGYHALNAKDKAGAIAAKTATKSLDKIGKAADKSTDAMLGALFMSVGSIAINKMNAKLTVPDDASEHQKNVNKVQKDVLSAGIDTMAKSMGGSSSNNSGNNKNNKNNGTKYSDKVGKPSNKRVDKQSHEYQSLFSDSNGNKRDEATRADIKNMANAGYDIDQIKEYLSHGDDTGMYLGILYPKSFNLQEYRLRRY